MSWSSVRLGDTCDVIAGGTPKRSEPSYWSGDIPWVKISDMLEGRISQTEETITRAGLEGSSAKLLPSGTLLVSIFATIGRTAVLECEAATNQAIVGVIPRQQGQFDDRFLQYCLRKKTQELQRQGRGVAQANINGSVLKATVLPVPPLAEQKQIAGILDVADALRAKRREALAELDTLLQSTFLDLFGDPVTNPKGWESRPFGEITADTKLGLVRSSKEFGWDFKVPYVRMDAVTATGAFLPDKVQRTNADERELKDYALKSGDFLFNTRNSKQLVGKVCVFPGPEGWLFNNNLMRVRFYAGVEPTVIAMQFRFRSVQHELEKRKSGTTSVFAIYWKSLKTLPVLVPPSDLQRRYAAIVESIDQQKAHQRAHLSELDTLFASLQSRAFQGNL